MGTKYVCWLSVFLLVSLTGTGVRGDALRQDPGPDGIVSVEAEHFDKNTPQGGHEWVLVTDPLGFTGTGAMRAMPDSGTNNNANYLTDSPRLDYEVNFAKTGTVYVWVRAYGPDGSSDSCHSGLDNQAIATADRISNYGTAYTWTNTAYEDPERIMFEVKSPGKHTFNLWMREDGTIVDKIVLTTNPDYKPTGDGPAESFRGPVLTAYGPKPENGAAAVVMPLFGWSAGDAAVFHNVYLGTQAELTEADLAASHLPLTMYFHVPGLQAGTAYYWRVDEIEVDGVTVHKGDVWTFTSMSASAWSPKPRVGAKWIEAGATLDWQAGMGGVTHEVYLGTSRDAVTNRDASTFQGKQAGLSLKPGALTADTTYYWAVDEVDLTGKKIAGEVWQFSTTGPGAGGGVKAEYFRGMDPSVGAPVLTRVEPNIDHQWGNGEVIPGISDQICARWTADLEILFPDKYTFITTSDDGVRLFLNGQRIINNWTDHGTTDNSSPAISLEPGVYPLVMEWYENGGGAVARLSWQTAAMARQIIPGGPLQPPVRASGALPPDKAVDVAQNVVLRWNPGEEAKQHDVYFGEDQAAVAAADTSSSLYYKGRQALDKTSFSPGELEWNKTYYWRIDEVNDANPKSPWSGSIWSFTTANFIVVDDMESYTDNEGSRIYEAWVDGWTNGTGSTAGNTTAPFAERTIVHAGKQSLPMDYNNTKTPFYSEVEQTFSPLRNWTINDVNALSLSVRGQPAGFVDKGNGAFTVGASGHDIWDNADDFRFVYKRLSGDGSVIVKVESLVNTNGWAKAGVMIRQSLNADSAMAYMIESFSSGVSFGWRQSTGATCGSATQAGIAAPQWVKLTRTGNAFTAQYSADGKTWKDIVDANGKAVSTTIMMTGSIYIGLCTTSHNTGATTTAQYTGAATTGGVTGSWQAAWIGDDPDRTNGVANLYVVVEDSAGKTATVSDPALVNVTAWTEWKIPLSSLTGINLAKVKKLSIGVGDKKNPTADGAGRIYIDDIRVTKP